MGFDNYYKGSIKMGAGLKPKAAGYALMQTCDIQVTGDKKNLDEYLEELGIGGGVQANYAVNDSSDPAYIQDRPFYDASKEVTLEKTASSAVIEKPNNMGSFWKKYYRVSDEPIDKNSLIGAVVYGTFLHSGEDGEWDQELTNTITEGSIIEKDGGFEVTDCVYVVTDPAAYEAKTGIPFGKEGVYLCQSYQEPGMYGETTEYKKLVCTKSDVQTLPNKFLNLKGNEDFQKVESLAKGANQAVSFSNYSSMISAFNNYEMDRYPVGQNVMIVTLDVPDLWVSDVLETKKDYTYVDDDTFVTALKTPPNTVQVGHYVLSPLETLKVDLNDYVTNEDYAKSTTAGVVKTGYTTDNNTKNYAVQVDGNGNAFVNVPWSALEFDGGIIDNLESNDTTAALSANQGRVLNNRMTTFEDESLEFFSTDGSTGLQYYINGTSVSCTGRGECTDSDVRIGSIVKGVPVTEIGNMALMENEYMESVTIPDSIKSIGMDAFWGCTRLKNVYITDLATWCNISFETTSSNPLYHAKNLYLNGELITDLVIPDSVTKIPRLAFSSRGIKSAIVPNTVESIEFGAFEGCAGLERITLPGICADGDYYRFASIFGGNSYGDEWTYVPESLKEVVINGDIKSVNGDAFLKCSNIESIMLPNAVHTIYSGAFRGCSSLKIINIPKNVRIIFNNAFSGCSALKSVFYEGTKTEWDGINIGENNDKLTDATIYYYSDTQPTVEGCYWHYVDGVPTAWGSINLEYLLNDDGQSYRLVGIGTCKDTIIIIPSTHLSLPVTSIDRCALQAKPYIKRIIVPDSVTSIDRSAFHYCFNLESVTIGNSVTSIGENAFYDCSSLTCITFGDNSKLTSIGNGAFSNCSSLTGITIPDSVTSIGSSAFYGCSNLESVTIGNGVTSIGNSAFSGCSSLTSITIPDSVTSIGYYAFYKCSSLTTVTIGNGVTIILTYTFGHCKSLTSITIPNSVTVINYDAFINCFALKDVFYQGTAAEWNAINIGAHNNYLCDATIHYGSEG